MTKSDKIDQIVLNRWLGIPIFFGCDVPAVHVPLSTWAAPLSTSSNILFGTIFVDGLGRLLSAIGMPDLITVVLADGMGWRYSNPWPPLSR